MLRDTDDAAGFLATVRAAAGRCGVTRLADVTGLDRIGMPVWQAVRPASRALCVHQGKGARPVAAKIGALCEAVESHCAEQVEPDGPHARFADLHPGERAPDLGDYGESRTEPPDGTAPIPWCAATDLVGGGAFYLPHALVSLDFRANVPSPYERSSNGLAAGPDEAFACAAALWELVERDALGRWLRASAVARAASRLDPGTIPFGWLREWRGRLAKLGIRLDVHELITVTGAPAFRCTITGRAEFGPGDRTFAGTASHPDPEAALFKAFSEAVQTRLTLIAGARDDLYHRHYRADAGTARPDGDMGGRRWRDHAVLPASVDWTVGRLADRGFGQVAARRLDRGLDGVAVVKAFVPGLGTLRRTRREPAGC